MDKYSGCNVVDSVVTAVEKQKRDKPKRRWVGAIARTAVAAAAVGLLLAVHYAPLPYKDDIKSALRGVFFYDAFGRTEFGTSAFFDADEEER